MVKLILYWSNYATCVHPTHSLLDRKLYAWNYFELKPICKYCEKRVILCSKLSHYKLKAMSISTWKSVKYKPLQLSLANYILVNCLWQNHSDRYWILWPARERKPRFRSTSANFRQKISKIKISASSNGFRAWTTSAIKYSIVGIS